MSFEFSFTKASFTTGLLNWEEYLALIMLISLITKIIVVKSYFHEIKMIIILIFKSFIRKPF